jgi:hypothetical protein
MQLNAEILFPAPMEEAIDRQNYIGKGLRPKICGALI